MDLFGRMEHYRARRGLSVAELVRRAGIARTYYYGIGKANNTGVDTLSRLAHVLDVDVADLIRDRPDTPDPMAVSLARCRDLLEQDGTDEPAEFAAVIELAWRARFQLRQ